ATDPPLLHIGSRDRCGILLTSPQLSATFPPSGAHHATETATPLQSLPHLHHHPRAGHRRHLRRLPPIPKIHNPTQSPPTNRRSRLRRPHPLRRRTPPCPRRRQRGPVHHPQKPRLHRRLFRIPQRPPLVRLPRPGRQQSATPRPP